MNKSCVIWKMHDSNRGLIYLLNDGENLGADGRNWKHFPNTLRDIKMHMYLLLGKLNSIFKANRKENN